MLPGDNACVCQECGVVCGGRFAGCPDVWERGPRPVTLVEDAGGLASGIRTNGTARRRAAPADDEPHPQVQAPQVAAPTAPDPGEAPPRQAASAAALRWLEGAFAGLRVELQSLRGTLNQQQATLAELVNGLTQQQIILADLLEAHRADVRRAAVVDSLPDRVEQAVTRGVASGQREAVDEILGAVESVQGQAVSALSGAFEKGLERIASSEPEQAAAQLRAFLETDGPTGSIVATIANQAATQALRKEVAKQLPAVLQRATDRSHAQMEELVERTEKAVARLARAGAKARAAAEPPAAEVTKAGATRTKAAKTTAKTKAAKTVAKPKAGSTAAKATKSPKAKAAKATKATGTTKGAGATKARTAGAGSASRSATATRNGATRTAVARRPARTAAAAAGRAGTGRPSPTPRRVRP